jgi:hypothetical protein
VQQSLVLYGLFCRYTTVQLCQRVCLPPYVPPKDLVCQTSPHRSVRAMAGPKKECCPQTVLCGILDQPEVVQILVFFVILSTMPRRLSSWPTGMIPFDLASPNRSAFVAATQPQPLLQRTYCLSNAFRHPQRHYCTMDDTSRSPGSLRCSLHAMRIFCDTPNSRPQQTFPNSHVKPTLIKAHQFPYRRKQRDCWKCIKPIIEV